LRVQVEFAAEPVEVGIAPGDKWDGHDLSRLVGVVLSDDLFSRVGSDFKAMRFGSTSARLSR